MPKTPRELKKLTKLNWFLLPFNQKYWWGWAVLARKPVRTLGDFDAHDRWLQSYLPFPSPLQELHTFTHSKETEKKKKKIHSELKKYQTLVTFLLKD